MIMVTHNANFVYQSRRRQVTIASAGPHTEQGLPPITYQFGGFEEEAIRRSVGDILEGGDLAFKDRSRRLRIALAR